MNETPNPTSRPGLRGSVERFAFVEGFDRQYHPCETGLHLCLINDDADLDYGPHVTLANIPTDIPRARRLFARLRPEFEASGDEWNVLVDLQIYGSTEDNFGMHRQMVERLQREVTNDGQ